ncbi:50S ribosomal protein L29 [Candidatus Woesearchaeota archaeon]|nr:50S ribosomal protein L29 [Candidatus Woesearchaeota archaeon]
MVKKKELKQLDKKGLKSKLEELKRDLMKINAQRSSGASIENPGRIKHIKKTIARIKTYIKNNKEENPKT